MRVKIFTPFHPTFGRHLMATAAALPQKTRELHNHHFDSTVWNDLQLRDDDVIIATYGKSGTTWTQQMVAQMLHGPDPDLPVAELSPWVDLRVPPKAVKLPLIEAQAHRRVLKTHLPVDALRFSPSAKYIYLARDGRDVVWSLHNHHANANAVWYGALNDTPGRVGPPIEPPPEDIVEYFRAWLEGDGYPFWSYWENIRTWWAIRELPNVKLIHFSELKRDPGGQMREIAEFLEIVVKPQDWPEIETYCAFDWMKANATKSAPLGGAFWDAGAETFINKGTNGRWQSMLPADLSAAYEQRAVAELGEDCAAWLAQR